MSILRILIVDDERPARAKANRLLAGIEGVEVVGEAQDGPRAVERIRSLRPDLVILDIQMPGMTGFQVLAALDPEQIPWIVFATAYDEHAIQAFEVAAVDYLLKPFNRERLARAVERVRARQTARDDRPAYLDELVALVESRTARHLERVVVESRGRRLLVDVGRVTRFEADGNYVAIHVAGKSYLCRGTLASYEARLDPERFVRVHRGTLVNVARISEMRTLGRGDQLLVMDDATEVRMSRRYRDGLERLLDP